MIQISTCRTRGKERTALIAVIMRPSFKGRMHGFLDFSYAHLLDQMSGGDRILKLNCL